MSVKAIIKRKLETALSPVGLEIEDQSHLHAGHAGAPAGGESHFAVQIVTAEFEGLNRLARQRLVNEALREELAGPIHALSIRALTPDEAKETP